jgi:DNA-binding CsgD family transcriptional regulator
VLRDSESLSAVLSELCRQAALGCGLTWVLASRVRDGVWSPWRLHDARAAQSDHPAWVRNTAIELERLALESAVTATVRPATVSDARRDERVHPPLRRLLAAQSFAVAPIAVRGSVFGLLHGDRRGSAPEITDEDRDRLWSFARSAARIIDRADQRERLTAQEQLVSATTSAARDATAAAQSQIGLTQLVGRVMPSAGHSRDADAPLPLAAVQRSLTPREREVLRLIVHGLDNAGIAERLIISRGTAKSHVRSIMRKFSTVNRAELIANYYRMALGDGVTRARID